MKIEARKMYRSNGLIDDLVLYGTPNDYLEFANFVQRAIDSKNPTLMLTESYISLEINCDETEYQLFTSLQNKENDYLSMEDWNNRNLLKVFGNEEVLLELQTFLKELSTWGVGYSYLQEYSKKYKYSVESPQWRLHVENT